MTCPTAFTYEEAAALWRELRDIKETLPEARAAQENRIELATQLHDARAELATTTAARDAFAAESKWDDACSELASAIGHGVIPKGYTIKALVRDALKHHDMVQGLWAETCRSLDAAHAERNTANIERDAARAEVERLTGDLNILKARQPDSLVAAVRAERDTARRAHEEALERIVTLSQEVTDARMDVRRACADLTTANDEAATAQSALRMTGTALAEARAERDTLARAFAAVRAVVAMVPGVEE
jgi:chromosome segregation ATPase